MIEGENDGRRWVGRMAVTLTRRAASTSPRKMEAEIANKIGGKGGYS